MNCQRAIGRGVLSGLLLLAAAAAGAQTVDELIAKNLAAKGGADKWKAVSTIKITGKISAQGMELPMTLMVKRPNLVIQEMKIQDKRVVQAFDGEHAWVVNPFMGNDAPQEVQGPQADLMRDQSDFDGPLVDYKSKGNTVELVGPDTLEGTKVYKLKVSKKSGQVQYVYLDAASGIDLKTSMEIQQGDRKMQVEQVSSNYRPENGLMVPHTMQSFINGQQVAQITVDTIEFGVPIDDGAFKMPKPPAPPK